MLELTVEVGQAAEAGIIAYTLYAVFLHMKHLACMRDAYFIDEFHRGLSCPLLEIGAEGLGHHTRHFGTCACFFRIALSR